MGLNKTKMFFNLKTGNYVKKETDDCDIKVVDVYLKNNKPIVNFYYHSDWNWLMEVVEKIESLGYLVNSKRNYCLIEYFGNDYEAKVEEKYFVNQKQWAASKKEAVYNACVEFSEWHNNQNSTKKK